MAAPTYSVTLHHLTSDAREAGLNYPDVQLSGITVEQLTGLLRSIEELAATLSIYEPSSPEIRVKTDREVFVIRTRYRHLCFVGNETALRGEEHGVAYIVGAISGNTETLAQPAITPRVFDRPPTAIPVRMHPRGGGGGFSDWAKIALLVVVSLSLVGGGVWMLFRPARSMAPKFTYLPSSEAVALLIRAAGQYQTGSQPGDRRLIVGNDGTLRIAKYGTEQTIAEELIRTARGALQDGRPALVTTDPYVIVVDDAESVTLHGLTFKRVLR